MLADEVDFVIGVDTHARTHTLVVVEAASGRTRSTLEIEASRRGYRQALRRVQRRAGGRRAWALEGSGSYGAGLARFLSSRGELTLEVERPRRGAQGLRSRRKSDALDAERAALTLLAGRAGQAPRLGPATQALRALLACREGAVRARTAALNELRALLLLSPDELRERLQGHSRRKLLLACQALRPSACAESERAACALALRSLARRVLALEEEAALLERELSVRVQALAPALLARPGVGPIAAARLLCAWSAPGRVRSEAAFARLAGVAPIPASSGKVVRQRLDRGGDRQLNRALHTVVLTRRRIDPETRRYIARRVGEGRSEREAVRCLKRYLARSLFRLLEREGIAQPA